MAQKHVILVTYPMQGHINPLVQFSNRLASRGLTTTLLVTPFILNSINPLSDTPTTTHIQTISDGYGDGGFAGADTIASYNARFREEGSKSLATLLRKFAESDNPVDCVVYDPFVPWALDVAKQFGLAAAAFCTQPCAVNFVYYCVRRKFMEFPVITSTSVSLPGLPELKLGDLPSLISAPESYPAYLELLMNQFSNAEEADCILVNTFYELESEVIDSMSKSLPNPLLAVGPTVPSLYLEKGVANGNNYGVNIYKMNPSTSLTWLSTKPKGSVVYVSFGSLVCLGEEQMLQLANAMSAIAASSFSFLWVVRDCDAPKLPKDFVANDSSKGLIVNWSPQLEVLASGAVGCFLTHAGWNSTIEALSLGVPMVVMPQWTDQPLNAKLVEDLWRVGVRVKAEENGIVRKDEIERCVKEVMGGGDKGKEVKENAKKWMELTKKAIGEGGSSEKNIDHFLSLIVKSR